MRWRRISAYSKVWRIDEGQELIERLNFLEEPRGLIRILQFIFAIFAFATAVNGGSSLSIGRSSQTDAVTASWSYPYHLQSTSIVTSLNKSQETLSLANDIKPSAEFFVFTGVTSMLISFAFVLAYILLDRQYRNDERYPIVDLLITFIWTIFWIAGSSAWAQGVSNLRAQTSTQYVMRLVTDCAIEPKCVETDCASSIISMIRRWWNRSLVFLCFSRGNLCQCHCFSDFRIS